jgi:uncharacterized RDD family membrane protein YckC
LVYCWKCGSESRDDAAFCPKCGASLKGTVGAQSATGLELLTHDKSVQNHWARRLIAFIIDVVIVSVALAVIAAITALSFLIGYGFPTTTSAFSTSLGWWGFWFGGVSSLVLFIYFFLAEGIYGRTIGKQILGLGVERLDGKPLDFRSSLIRNLSKISWILLLLDVLVGLGMHGEMSQKWSDRFVGTKVEAKTQMTIIP